LNTPESINELRDLILRAAPEPNKAAAVKTCGADEPLDALIPFSSLIVLGLIIAVEDHYQIKVTRKAFADALAGGATLNRLATMVRQLQTASDEN
jgi:acyl carrier protein